MDKNKLIQIFKNKFLSGSFGTKDDLLLQTDFRLENNATADLAILQRQDCLAIGNVVMNQLNANEEDIRKYFHGPEHSFVGCGTHSDYWFFFDGHNLTLNDHGYIYPYDEYLIGNEIASFLNRIRNLHKQNL